MGKTMVVCAVVAMLAVGACGGGDDGQFSRDQLELMDSTILTFTRLTSDTLPQASGVARRTGLTTSRIKVDLQMDTVNMHRGAIHAGTCDAIGEEVAPLLPLATDVVGKGSVTSTVQEGLVDLMETPHTVVYHEAGGNPGAPLVCAPIAPPAQAAPAGA